MRGSVERREALEMVEGAVYQPTDKFEARVVRVTEKTLAETIKAVDTDHI